ncbi:hypothetical protein, partial [Ectopseudomonas oleovorans]|uniref:hypothetical protein n=1 Tax=Ectopseudomonas oleovorans TaxID=301 RepID=UPI001B8017F6
RSEIHHGSRLTPYQKSNIRKQSYLGSEADYFTGKTGGVHIRMKSGGRFAAMLPGFHPGYKLVRTDCSPLEVPG